MSPTPLRAALYGRMSTDKQNPKSASDQLAEAKAFAETKGFRVVASFHDEGKSGAKVLNRDGYQEVLAGVRRREFDVLVVENTDRLIRDPEHDAHARKLFAFYAVRVMAYDGTYDSDVPGSDWYAHIQAKVNADLRATIGRKTHRGQSATVQRGFSAGGRAYGYRSEPVYVSGNNDIYGNPIPTAFRKVIHDEEAKWVRWIYRQYADGKSPRAIAAELNERKVPSPGATWKRTARSNSKRTDGKWMASTIHGQPEKGTGILCNPIYRGELVWNRTRWVMHPETERKECRPRPESEWKRQRVEALRVVSDELWNAVQARRTASRALVKDRTRPDAGGRPPRYPFSSLLVCAQCGSRYVIVDATHYGCASYTNGGKAACGNRVRVRRDVVEERLVATMRDDLLTADAVAGVMRELRKVSAERRSKSDNAEQEREARRKRLEQEVANLTDAIASGALRSSPAIATRLAQAETELRDLTPAPRRPTADVVDLLPRAESAYRKLVQELPQKMQREPDMARSLMRRVFRSITLRPTEDGGLEAELATSPAQLLTLVGGVSSGTSENNLVAGA